MKPTMYKSLFKISKIRYKGIVRYYYDVWTAKGEDRLSMLDYVLAKLTDIHRFEAGRNPLPSMLILDSKTIQNADTASEKGYDGGKKNQV